MTRKRIILIHVFIWLFAIFANLPFSNLGKSIPPAQVVTNIIAFLYLMLVFYLFYLFMVPTFLGKKKLARFFIYSFILILVMPFFGYTLLYLIRAISDNTFHDFYRGYTLKAHMSGYFPVMTAAVFGSFFRVIIDWFTTMNQKAELDRQNLSMQLGLLKEKMNPHFLFNTLNNIDSLIQTDQKAASEALIRLSEIMRYMTYEISSDTVELKQEVDHIKNLLELHRLRIKNPYEIVFVVDGYMKTGIAPGIFVPLIENAFKFASFSGEKPAIKISLRSACGIIIFNISNYFDKAMQVHDNNYSGTGLSNLRKRLDLIYPGKYTLDISEEFSIFFAKLTIDTNAY